MTTNQKITKLFSLIPTGGGYALDYFGKEFSKFLSSEKTELKKKKFIRGLLREISPKMQFFFLLSKFIDYKVTSDDLLLSIQDYSYLNISITIKEINKNFGKTLGKQCFEKILEELKDETDFDSLYLIEEIKKDFPKFC